MSYRYIGLADSFDLEADRHQRNGDRHAAEGRPDYAAGSYRKAQRKRERAASLREMLKPSPLTRRYVRLMEDALLHGTIR